MKSASILSALLLALCAWGTNPAQSSAGPKPQRADPPTKISETRYLAFEIFTWSPDPANAGFQLEGTTLPAKASILSTIHDLKTRIGTVGDRRTRLGFVLGPIGCLDQSDSDVTQFVHLAFELALETNLSVGIKLDDSIFWANRKELWSNPKNVEAMDWDGTPCTGRRLDWGPTPTPAPPQMCFNSAEIRLAVQHRARVFGHAIVQGLNLLNSRHRPELFVGVIAGTETMIGQDFATGNYLGYRALMNRGFSREHQPADIDRERESVVNEFIDLWTSGLAAAGVPKGKIYSHTAFLSHRVFDLSDHSGITYSQQNHFAPPSVAFGENHRPGFSTYPQPGLFEEIYAQLKSHKQAAWASCEGTNLQLGAGPGHSGMTMETYLAKMFNHGATLVDIFSWGIGGELNRNNEFRQVTESSEALSAYRKFLNGHALDEAAQKETLLERLPTKIRKIQNELAAWIQRTHRQSEAQPLIEELQSALHAKDFNRAEAAADALLKLIALR